MEKISDQEIIKKIEDLFRVPDRVLDKVNITAEKVRGGYAIFENRVPWDGSDKPWSKSPVAKIILHRLSDNWKVYWMRTSGRWEFYGQYTSINKALKIIDEDVNGCFWG